MHIQIIQCFQAINCDMQPIRYVCGQDIVLDDAASEPECHIVLIILLDWQFDKTITDTDLQNSEYLIIDQSLV